VIPAGAQTAASLRDKLQTGHTISIIDEDGRKVQGRVVDVSDQAIRVSVHRAIERIPIESVVRIEKPDSLKNGAYAGLFIGATFGLVGGLANSGRTSDRNLVVASIAGNAVAWTAFGVGIDAMVNTRRTLYQRSGKVERRAAPLVGAGVRGAALSIAW
jgi:hypothetical protein